MWYKKFDSFIVDQDYNRTETDHCVYFRKFFDDNFVIFLLYVEDMLIIGQDLKMISKLKGEIS